MSTRKAGAPLNMQPIASASHASESGKIVSAAEAVRLIREGDTVATGGFVGIGFPESVAVALEEFYLRPEELGAAGQDCAQQQDEGTHPSS